MSQEELGEILGVKKSAIQKYESGAVSDLKASTIRTLCYTFHTYPSYFVFPEHHEFLKETIEKIGGSQGETKYKNRTDMLIEQLMQKQRTHDLLMLITSSFELSDKGFERLVNYAADLRQIKEYMGDIRPGR